MTIRILITAIGGGGHGEQILKALEVVAADRDYEILGADANPNCAQFSRVSKHFVLPFASHPDYLDKLIEICESNRIDVLFHGCEPELRLFSTHRDHFLSRNIFLPINPRPVIDICMDKIATMQRLTRLGFEPPKYWQLSRVEDLELVDEYPCIIKPSVGSGGSANCFIAQTRNQLAALADYLELWKTEQDFIVQQYVGTPDDEYTVGVLSDMDGEYINSIALRRSLKSQLNVRVSVPNQSARRELGDKLVISSGISNGYVDEFVEINNQCAAIAKAIGSCGPLNIQCRFVDGKVRVFEINPRFSGTTSIRATMGFNEPDVLIRKHLLNELITPNFDYRSGWVFRTLQETYQLSD